MLGSRRSKRLSKQKKPDYLSIVEQGFEGQEDEEEDEEDEDSPPM